MRVSWKNILNDTTGYLLTEIYSVLSEKQPLPLTWCLCCAGAHFKNKGVQPLLDAVIVRYLPSPLDVPAVDGLWARMGRSVRTEDRRDGESFSGLVFKLMSDSFR